MSSEVVNGIEIEVGNGTVLFWKEGTMEGVDFPIEDWPQVKEAVDRLLEDEEGRIVSTTEHNCIAGDGREGIPEGNKSQWCRFVALSASI